MRASLPFGGLLIHPGEKASHGSNMEVLGCASVAVPLLCYGWGFRATSVPLPSMGLPLAIGWKPTERRKKYFCGVRWKIYRHGSPPPPPGCVVVYVIYTPIYIKNTITLLDSQF